MMARDVAREAWERRALCRILSTCLRCGEVQVISEEQLTGFGAWAICPACKYPERLLWWKTNWTEGSWTPSP